MSIYINYSNTTKNNILFIKVSASRRKPSSGLTSGAGRQYVKACPIRGSVGSSVRMGQVKKKKQVLVAVATDTAFIIAV